MMLICCEWLKKEFVVESLWFRNDMRKLTTSVWRISIWKNRNLSSILMLTIFTVGLRHSHCLSVISSGWQKVVWKTGEKFPHRKAVDVSLRLIWSIRKNFTIFTTIILSHQKWLLWIKLKNLFQLYERRTSLFCIIGILNNILRWGWFSRKLAMGYH